MLNVFITIDTEIWCNGWKNLDERFPASFNRYVYGPTKKGNFALPGTLDILSDHGLKGVFFLEPLFSARFGLEPLIEIVEIIQTSTQEIQLHLHPEWVDESGDTLLKGITQKIPYLSCCSLQQQIDLISWGKNRLVEAGVTHINAFRAGGYAANSDTLRAVAENNIKFDSSYNPAGSEGIADMSPGQILTQPCFIEGVYEYPVSIMENRKKTKKRIMQITACSFSEFIHCLNQAYDKGWDSIIIVSHNFELLSPDKSKVDEHVLNRFIRICKYLELNSDRFYVRGFHELEPTVNPSQPEPLIGNPIETGLRMAEQLVRHLKYN
jgi:hypothetical protein